MIKKKKYKYEWVECKKCGRPYNKKRECIVCNPPHFFVEDDILAYQYHSLKKTTGGSFQLFPPEYSYTEDGGVKDNGRNTEKSRLE